VGDLCRAILLGLESDVAGEVFQIATGVETSVLGLAALLRSNKVPKITESTVGNPRPWRYRAERGAIFTETGTTSTRSVS
jgi:hypothetical protein